MADQKRIYEKGGEIFRLMAEERPSVFDRGWWAGRILDLAMRNHDLKVQLFRYMDVFPSLSSTDLIISHLREYFLDDKLKLPGMLKPLISAATSPVAAAVTAAVLRRDVKAFSGTLITGEGPEQALGALKRIREEGRSFTVDILGEAAVSEKEALHYQAMYLALAERLAHEIREWPSRDTPHERNFPPLNVSVKLSSLYSRLDPRNYEDSVTELKNRLRPVLRKVMELDGFVNLDMETYCVKGITLDVFTELLAESEFKGWNGCGLAVQAYLKESLDDLNHLDEWAAGHERRITVRLIKGAYWEYENVVSSQRNWPLPVFERKSHTDWNFERCVEWIIDHSRNIDLAVGTHNVRSIATVIACAEERGLPPGSYEFQMLYGMAEPVKRSLGKMGYVVREYAPVGELLPGMAYLVRRLLENTSNEGFLRKRFAENASAEELLSPPEPPTEPPPEPLPDSLPPDAASRGDVQHDLSKAFSNEPLMDFSVKEERRLVREAIAAVRETLGREYPAVIGGDEIYASRMIRSVNPAAPDEIIGTVSSIGRKAAGRAVRAAKEAQPAWAESGYEYRAGLLAGAADIARSRRHELIALQILEAGKNWVEADADVCEAIDYLDYYAREMTKLGPPSSMGECAGEENRYLYRPMGVGLVIAPWNFPLAISMGMVSAALVAGNAVLYKPSSLTPVNGWQVFSILRDAGVPEGVLNFLPGPGVEVGNNLVEHDLTDFIAFTGSREVGLGIVQRAGLIRPGQRGIKRVIAEMGGKNAIIVDADADLDLAVTGVLQSAFGYQGQKCSACSRVIVLKDCYERFIERLEAAVSGITVGPPEDPAFFMGPVIDESARKKIQSYARIGRKEGRVLAEVSVPEKGYYVSPMLITDLPANSRVLREEIFGPVLSVLRATDIDDAINQANRSVFGLTGGIYSRSPEHIRLASDKLEVGNLYINRGITGAVVGRQPFGGIRMSGIGSKAGGPDYLRQFMRPAVVTENTMRRGFAPDVGA